MKLLFCGTPGFAVSSLQKLMVANRHKVVGVVTQPDKPRGRCRTPQPSPVKEVALFHALPVYQPERPGESDFISQIRKLGADCAVVVAYGRILPKEFLTLFRFGAINLHASLLPKYRGAAPIAWALMDGEPETGASIIQLDEELDHGPVLLTVKTPIQPTDDGRTLAARLAEIGADALLKTLDLMEAGQTKPVPQEHRQATHAPMLSKSDGIIRWDFPAEKIANRVRGLQPWPGAVTWAGDKTIKILAVTLEEPNNPLGLSPSKPAQPGTVLLADPDKGLWVQTGKGILRIDKLQLAGGNPMTAAEFLRGHLLPAGSLLHTSTHG